MDNAIGLQDVIVCPGCDMIVTTEPIQVPYGSHLVCPRCRFKLRGPIKDTVNRTLALSLTGLIIFIPAHFLILLTLDMFGLQDSGSVFDSIRAIYQQKYGLVSLVVFLTAQIFPLLKLGLLFFLSLGIARKIFVERLPAMLRWYRHLEEWGMSEVYLIAILVTIIKMESSTRITYEIGFICFAWLVIIMACISCTFDRQYYWTRIEELLAERNLPGKTSPEVLPASFQGKKAIASGLFQCHTCHKVLPSQESGDKHAKTCPRCGSTVHGRKSNSVSATWALVLTALILSLPANILPIMDVELFGESGKKTIMDGIIYFFQDGFYGIGLIILCASILVPLFKVLGLSVLLYSINFRRATRLLHKAIMFRFISFIGRWSMLDIFVIAILCAVVNFRFFTSVQAAPAATFFTCVVLATMFAAITFDERLLWDAADQETQGA